MTENENAAINAANAAIEAATDHIKGQREAHRVTKIKAYCITAFACVLLVCASVVACFTIYCQQHTIIEQQYALNMQYASLMEYVSGAEIITTYQADSGENGNAIVGDGNMIAGGDVNNGDS